MRDHVQYITIWWLFQGYRNAHAMLDVDRHNLLGIVIPADPLDIHKPPQTPLNRMQHFLTDVHDTCYHTLGNAFPSLSRDLYRLPHLAESLIITVLSNLEVSICIIKVTSVECKKPLGR